MMVAQASLVTFLVYLLVLCHSADVGYPLALAQNSLQEVESANLAQWPLNEAEPRPSRKIAIIGAGITGAVAAFNLYENGLMRKSGPPEITIFERNPIVGGRITTTKVFGRPKYTIDTCARVFSPTVDNCISSAAFGVGLSTRIERNERAGTGVWDGSQFVGFTEDDGIRDPSGWSLAKRLRWFQRYGDTPFRLEDDFSNIVNLRYGRLSPINNINRVVKALNLKTFVKDDICQTNILDCSESKQDMRYLQEVLGASTRERFFGDDNELNALDTILGLYTSSQSSIIGGNLRLIDRLIKLSDAQVYLNTSVTRILDTGSKQWRIETNSTDSSLQAFDAVIIAAPFSLSNILLPPDIDINKLPRLNYIDTVVTHFTTSSTLNATYFNTSEPAPQNILTTNPRPGAYPGSTKTRLPPFFSLTLIENSALNPDNDQMELLYKIVSKSVISDQQIAQFLNRNENITEPVISWIDRQILPNSVPRLERNQVLQGDLEIAPRLFYAGGGEQIASQIEVGCRIGKSVAQRIVPAKFD